LPRVRTIHVAGGAHDSDAREVDEPGDGGAEQGFESRVVFLHRHAVDAGAVRGESCKVLEGLGKDAAAVVCVACGYVAFDDARGSCARCVNRCLGGYVVCLVGLRKSAVIQSGSFGEANGQRAQCSVGFEDFSPVNGLGVFIWSYAALGNVASAKICRYFVWVEFILQGDLDSITSKSYRAESCDFRVYSSNAAD
jgi:hypothetical protein